VSVYKKELSEIAGKYATFLTSIKKIITSQESTLMQMSNEFKEKE
jgi:hypothetical protein